MKKEAKKPRKVKKTHEKTPKKSIEGHVTLKDICDELDVEGRIARRKLRTSDIEKPEGSWSWPEGHEDIERVKELLK